MPFIIDRVIANATTLNGSQYIRKKRSCRGYKYLNRPQPELESLASTPEPRVDSTRAMRDLAQGGGGATFSGYCFPFPARELQCLSGAVPRGLRSLSFLGVLEFNARDAKICPPPPAVLLEGPPK